MMGARIVIEIDGLTEVIANLGKIEEKAAQNLETITAEFARDSEQVMKQVTHVRSGRLQAGDKAVAEGLSFTLQNGVRYYIWASGGHMTPRGWRTRRGYRLAKRRSYVEGIHITEKTLDYVRENITDRYSKFLDNI